MLIRGAHVLDPREDLDGPHDILVRKGHIAELGPPGTLQGCSRAVPTTAGGGAGVGILSSLPFHSASTRFTMERV